MEYDKILKNIMFHCKDVDEVEKYLAGIATKVKNSALSGTIYQLFVDYANIYAKVRECLENYPFLADIYDCDTKQTYDAMVVHANLEYSLKRMTKFIQDYLNAPITCTPN